VVPFKYDSKIHRHYYSSKKAQLYLEAIGVVSVWQKVLQKLMHKSVVQFFSFVFEKGPFCINKGQHDENNT